VYLIVGGDSVIGSALSAYWQAKGISHCASTRSGEAVSEKRLYIELASKSWPELKKNRYDAVVFCAAVTKLADCEDHPETTRKINVEATIALANLLSRRGSYLLLLSTNQVFDGSLPMRKVSEQVCPVNEYGRQKAEAERLILQIPRSAALRLTKVIHPDMSLLKQWESSLQAGQPIEAFADMNIAPIFLEDVVARIDNLIQNRETGIFHLSGERDVSYYEFAKNYFKSIPNAKFLIKKSYMKNSQTIRSTSNLYTALR
jgi:dTDP-4-dehydrorhamnose reductase